MKKYLFIIFFFFTAILNTYGQDNIKAMFEKSWSSDDTLEKRTLRENIIKLSPDSEYGLFCKAWILSTWNNYLSAEEFYSKAINKKNNFWQAYFNRGTMNLNLQKYNEALSDFKKSIELNPNDAEAYGYLGISNYYLTNYQEAISNSTKSISINSNNADAYN